MEDFEFFCVICGQSLCASLDLAGTTGECPTCLSIVPIPGSAGHCREAALPNVPHSPENFSVEIVYQCEHCNQPLQIDARWQGIAHDCPACAAKTRVPTWNVSSQARNVDSPTAHSAHLTPDEVAFLTTVSGTEENGHGPPMPVALK